jgi:hypothetical protein
MKYSFFHFWLSGQWTSLNNWVPVKNIMIIAFFGPIVGDTLGTTLSHVRGNIVGE